MQMDHRRVRESSTCVTHLKSFIIFSNELIKKDVMRIVWYFVAVHSVLIHFGGWNIIVKRIKCMNCNSGCTMLVDGFNKRTVLLVCSSEEQLQSRRHINLYNWKDSHNFSVYRMTVLTFQKAIGSTMRSHLFLFGDQDHKIIIASPLLVKPLPSPPMQLKNSSRIISGRRASSKEGRFHPFVSRATTINHYLFVTLILLPYEVYLCEHYSALLVVHKSGC